MGSIYGRFHSTLVKTSSAKVWAKNINDTHGNQDSKAILHADRDPSISGLVLDSP